MQILITGDDVLDKFPIRIDNGNNEPKPLGCPKQRYGILNSIKIRVVPHFYEFSKLDESNVEDVEWSHM
jgi:hypothetical protein